MTLEENVLRAPALLVNAMPIIFLIAIVGYLALIARWTLFVSAPVLADNSWAIATLLNLVIDTFAVLMATVIPIVMDIIKTFITVIKLIRSLVKGHPHFSDPHLTKPSFPWGMDPTPIKAADVRDWLHKVPIECAPYNNIITVGQRTLRALLSEYVCPVIRVTYPVPWLWRLSNSFLGWLSYDAHPLGAPIFGGRPGNCQPPEDGVNWLCVGLGSGYVVAEVILPFFLLVVLGGALLVPIVEVAFRSAKTAVRQVAVILKKVLQL